MSEHGENPPESTEPRATRPRARRPFWSDLFAEVLSIGEEIRGIAQRPLSDMGALPDSVLAEMVPVWRQAVPLDIREDGIYRAGPNGATCAYSFRPHEKIMVDQYACGRNLSTIASYVARVSGMEQDQAFEATKTLFIQLCQRGWCHPAASHAPAKGEEA